MFYKYIIIFLIFNLFSPLANARASIPVTSIPITVSQPDGHKFKLLKITPSSSIQGLQRVVWRRFAYKR